MSKCLTAEPFHHPITFMLWTNIFCSENRSASTYFGPEKKRAQISCDNACQYHRRRRRHSPPRPKTCTHMAFHSTETAEGPLSSTPSAPLSRSSAPLIRCLRSLVGKTESAEELRSGARSGRHGDGSEWMCGGSTTCQEGGNKISLVCVAYGSVRWKRQQQREKKEEGMRKTARKKRRTSG